jgi:RsiW-degrading membrane proteinase PrsW (M82 family)
VYGKWSVAAVSALLLPFVFVAELLGIAMLFAIPEALSVPTILVIVAIVEELAKSLHVYAGYAHRRFDPGVKSAVVVGAFAGFGFFVGEKLTLVAQLVGLPERIVEGQAALGSTGTGLPSIPLVVAFLFAPLVLHAVTAAISAIGASRGRRSYGVALSIAIVVHFLYNLTVVNISGTI